MKKRLFTAITLSLSFLTYAGGNPENVHLPEGYQSTFTKYETRNRANGKQVAVFYANKAAIESASSGNYADGSKVIMEIYKTIPGEDGKPLMGEHGVFQKGKFAAIGVMEKNTHWESSYSADERAGNWGFALYKTDGSVKENKLECASCHIPLASDDYLFTHSKLTHFNHK